MWDDRNPAEGHYSGPCELSLDIKKLFGKYIYTMQVKNEIYSGDISLSKDEDITYVTFEGIPWIENIGMLKSINGDDFEEMESVETYGVDGVLTDNGDIEIQNYGNAMNYYLKLDCDEKYIIFTMETLIATVEALLLRSKKAKIYFSLSKQ
jgi:hypothetical protein